MLPSTLEGFKKHGERHGTDQLLQAAIELHWGEDDLVKLQEWIDTKHPRQKHRLSARIRVRRELGLPDTEDEKGD